MKLKTEDLIKPQLLMIFYKNRENLGRVAKFLMVNVIGGNENIYSHGYVRINTNERENNYEN
jgi:hypothetical protein